MSQPPQFSGGPNLERFNIVSSISGRRLFSCFRFEVHLVPSPTSSFSAALCRDASAHTALHIAIHHVRGEAQRLHQDDLVVRIVHVLSPTPPFVLLFLPFLSGSNRTKSSTGTFPHSPHAEETLMAPAVRGKAHTCRIRRSIVLMTNRSVSPWPKPSWPSHIHTLDNSTSTFATMLALVRLQCMGHLFVANCIRTSPASLPSSLSPTTERLFIASLSVAFSVEMHSQTHTFRITCLDVPRNLPKPSQHSELLCMESRAQVGHYLLSCIPLTSHQAGCPGHGGTQRKLPQCDASTQLFPPPKKDKVFGQSWCSFFHT